MSPKPPVSLPTRVVHVGRPDQGRPPRLVETRGMRAHYIALSHCWGAPAYHPPMTTQSTLADHLAGIPCEAVSPAAFQDALTATRRLGFDYIWIDSLCIIQDSHYGLA